MELHINKISKSYGSLTILHDVTMTLRQDTCYCLMSPSGSGKTTLLRILMGLEHPDSGSVTVSSPEKQLVSISSLKVSAVFQEDLLVSFLSPVENVKLTAGAFMEPSLIRQEMKKLLPEECLDRPVSTLSGGMKRRTAILRAMLTPSELLLMDEPFTGLDEEMRRHVIAYIRKMRGQRFLLLTTHQAEEAQLLNGQIITLS